MFPKRPLFTLAVVALSWLPASSGVPALAAQGAPATSRSGTSLPRTADGKPNLQGIWQVRNRAAYDLQDHAARFGMPAGKGVVEGGEIPYQPSAMTKKAQNFANRATADPLTKCYMPGVPRIMYMEFPFQIFQTRDHIAITFEWSQVYRVIYTNGTKPRAGFWRGVRGAGKEPWCRRHEQQRPDVVRHGRELSQRSAA